MDATWLREAYRRTRKDGAGGVTSTQCETALEVNLMSLLERFIRECLDLGGRIHGPSMQGERLVCGGHRNAEKALADHYTAGDVAGAARSLGKSAKIGTPRGVIEVALAEAA